MNWTWEAIASITYKELIAAYDTKLLHDWDQSAAIVSVIHNVGILVHNMAGRSKIRPRTIYDFHPFRRRPRQGLRITTENFGMLRTLAEALVKKR